VPKIKLSNNLIRQMREEEDGTIVLANSTIILGAYELTRSKRKSIIPQKSVHGLYQLRDKILRLQLLTV
jgi:hypothetical protein